MIPEPADPELLLFSAETPSSLNMQIRTHYDFYEASRARGADIAYTRAMRREALRHRAFSILHEGEFLSTSSSIESRAQPRSLVLVFSGQGAQWAGMGKELIQTNTEFRADIETMDEILGNLKKPPAWKILGRMRLSWYI